MLYSDILTSAHPVEILQPKIAENVMNYLPKCVVSERYTEANEGIFGDQKIINLQ